MSVEEFVSTSFYRLQQIGIIPINPRIVNHVQVTCDKVERVMNGGIFTTKAEGCNIYIPPSLAKILEEKFINKGLADHLAALSVMGLKTNSVVTENFGPFVIEGNTLKCIEFLCSLSSFLVMGTDVYSMIPFVYDYVSGGIEGHRAIYDLGLQGRLYIQMLFYKYAAQSVAPCPVDFYLDVDRLSACAEAFIKPSIYAGLFGEDKESKARLLMSCLGHIQLQTRGNSYRADLLIAAYFIRFAEGGLPNNKWVKFVDFVTEELQIIASKVEESVVFERFDGFALPPISQREIHVAKTLLHYCKEYDIVTNGSKQTLQEIAECLVSDPNVSRSLKASDENVVNMGDNNNIDPDILTAEMSHEMASMRLNILD